MSLFRRKPSMHIQHVDPDMLLHRFLLDSQMHDPQALSILLGLNMVDDPDTEQMLSDGRLVQAAILLPLIRLFGGAMSYSVIEYLRTHTDDYDALSDDSTQVMRNLLETVSVSTVLGTITQLHDLGLVTYTWSTK